MCLTKIIKCAWQKHNLLLFCKFCITVKNSSRFSNDNNVKWEYENLLKVPKFGIVTSGVFAGVLLVK